MAAVSRIKVNVAKPRYEYYDVPGRAWSTVRRKRFDVRRTLNLEYDALTTSTMTPTLHNKVLLIEMSTTILLPRAPQGDAETQKFLRALKCHEEWHFRSNAALLRKSARDAPVPLSVEKASAFVEHVLRLQEAANERYDTLTNHGCSFTRECGNFDCSLPRG